MKHLNKILVLTVFFLSPNLFAERVITVDVAGTLSSAETVKYDGSTTYSTTCLVSTNCCFSYTITVPNTAPPNPIFEGTQYEGTLIDLNIPGMGLFSGVFLYYDNQPVPGGNILVRTYLFTIMPIEY